MRRPLHYDRDLEQQQYLAFDFQQVTVLVIRGRYRKEKRPTRQLHRVWTGCVIYEGVRCVSESIYDSVNAQTPFALLSR